MDNVLLEKAGLLHPFGVRNDKTTGVINWKDSPSIQRLLDVISSIIAEEYIIVAKQNPSVFLEVSPEKMGQSTSGTV